MTPVILSDPDADSRVRLTKFAKTSRHTPTWGFPHLIFDFRTSDPYQTEDRMAQFAEEVMALN
ncbi:MAG: hypothetical protein Ct9H300mP11_30000 [Chloroflexota bacterium]|nr:MAG: hypothetical protein Ct9H300mP11_30000 [Chloroflexota bacterium]